MNKFLLIIDKLFSHEDNAGKHRYIVNDGCRSPEKILSKRKYIKEFDPSVEDIDNEHSLVINVRDSALEKFRNKNFDFDRSTTQIIYDDKFISGINGYIFIIR